MSILRRVDLFSSKSRLSLLEKCSCALTAIVGPRCDAKCLGFHGIPGAGIMYACLDGFQCQCHGKW